MGASPSRLQITYGGRRFTKMRPKRRGLRIRRRVQSIWRLLQKLRLSAVHKLWPQVAARRHRRLRQSSKNSSYSQELDVVEVEDPISSILGSNKRPVIPGLPQDLALQCLARVPRVLHGRLRSVSKLWRQVAESREFLEARKKVGTTEDWIYLHVGATPQLDEVQGNRKGGRWEIVGGFSSWHALDPDRYRWYALPPIPYDEDATGGQVVLGTASAVVDDELYVLGGAPFGRPALRDVWIYNPGRNRWRKGRSMLTPRFGCLVGVIDRNLYAVGGSEVCHLTGYSVPCLEIFDADDGAWRYGASLRNLATQHPCSRLQHVAVVEEKLLVTGPQRLRGRMNAGMYDPALNMWTDIKPGLRKGWGRPCTILDGKLYTVGLGGYHTYCPDRDTWVPVRAEERARSLEWDPQSVAAMAASNGKLYMVGTMGPALIVIVAPVTDGRVDRTMQWHTMKLPNGLEFLGDLSFCSCQILNI